MDESHFPTRLFSIYFLYYAGQAVYNTYVNLYLADAGLSQSQIGLTVSISTLFLLLVQTFWGNLSDRSKNKNNILKILFLGSTLTVCLFYVSKAFWFLLLVITLFSMFFVPIVPISDNITLELLEKSRWDYGQVRMGGTIGYAITVLAIGFVLNGRYREIFWMVAVLLTSCLLLSLRLPRVQGYRSKKRKTPYKEILKNRNMVALIAFSLAFYMGSNFYNNFYAIYFRSIGGTSAQIGVMMFACASTEVPCLLFMNRLVKRFGVQRVMICAGLVTCLRWFLLFLLNQPYLIIAASLLHGFGFTAFSYSIITYINEHVPKDLRATSQSLNALVCSVFSRVIFGFLGGIASEWLGANHIMLFSCAIMAVATAWFALWSHNNFKKTSAEPENTQSI